jgi:osmotically-inducible protein OsmY
VVTNLITVRPRIVAADVKRRIEDAFRRSAEVDAQQITVETRDSEVILRGSVHSLHEKDEAQRTAWRAPGVTRVVNDIVVKP